MVIPILTLSPSDVKRTVPVQRNTGKLPSGMSGETQVFTAVAKIRKIIGHRQLEPGEMNA